MKSFQNVWPLLKYVLFSGGDNWYPAIIGSKAVSIAIGDGTETRSNAAFLPAVNTTSQPVNWPRTVSQVVYTTGELGASRDFPNFDLQL